jgi:hypothetical protein
LGLSLALHALLLACAFIIPSSSRHAGAMTARPPSTPLSLTLSWEGRRKPPPGRPGPPDVLPDEIDPTLLPRDKGIEVGVSPIPAAPSGDGGDGNGSRGGAGAAATGGAPSLLAAPGKARRIAYVIDHSMSMGSSGALERAKKEVLASLRALPPEARFQVIVYNHYANSLLPGGWLTPDDATLASAKRRLNDLSASGTTDHVRALREALVARPDLLFWVTDADDLNEAAVRAVTRLNAGGASIHVVELAAGRGDPKSLLARLAKGNGGEHRRVAPE